MLRSFGKKQNLLTKATLFGLYSQKGPCGMFLLMCGVEQYYYWTLICSRRPPFTRLWVVRVCVCVSFFGWKELLCFSHGVSSLFLVAHISHCHDTADKI